MLFNTYKNSYCCLLFCPGSGPVREFSLVSINDTTFEISFAAPISPNGVISHYEISVEDTIDALENFTHSFAHSDQKKEYLAYITGLCKDEGLWLPSVSLQASH